MHFCRCALIHCYKYTHTLSHTYEKKICSQKIYIFYNIYFSLLAEKEGKREKILHPNKACSEKNKVQNNTFNTCIRVWPEGFLLRLLCKSPSVSRVNHEWASSSELWYLPCSQWPGHDTDEEYNNTRASRCVDGWAEPMPASHFLPMQWVQSSKRFWEAKWCGSRAWSCGYEVPIFISILKWRPDQPSGKIYQHIATKLPLTC